MDKAILNAIDELRRLDPQDRAAALKRYSTSQALAIFEQLEASLQQELLEWLPAETIHRVLMDLDPDDRVQLLDTLPEPITKTLLACLSPHEWRMTQKLLSYPEDSAGHIMTPEYLPLSLSMTAAQALEFIRREGGGAGTVNTLPVLDANGRLHGVVNLSQLVLAPCGQPVSEFMLNDVPTVMPETDQEEAVRMIQLADLLALPVVDTNARLLGLITVDDALDVFQMEREEDFARSGASEPLDRPYFSIGMRELAQARLFWLLLLAVAGAMTVQVLNVFENVLEQVIALSLFIPLLIGVGGNSGAQSATTVARAIATNEIPPGRAGALRVVGRETGVGLMLGGVLGLVGFPVVTVLFGVQMAATVSLTLIAICILATMVGSGMPLLAKRFNIDPAVVSAPLVTTVVDASGLVLYFVIARTVLGI